MSYDITEIKNTTGINDLDVTRQLIPFLFRYFYQVEHKREHQELTVMRAPPDIVNKAILDCVQGRRPFWY